MKLYDMTDAMPEKPYRLIVDVDEISEHATIEEAEAAMDKFIREDAREMFGDGSEWTCDTIEIVQVRRRMVLVKTDEDVPEVEP